jgi:hypothetical protein
MVAHIIPYRYASRAGAKSSAGCASPNSNRRNSAHHDGVFFMPVNYGGLCVGGFGLPDSYLSGLAHLRTVCHPSCASDLADSNQIGVLPMAKLRLFPTRNPAEKAAAHRAMAKAALFADSSAKTRLKRYNHHIEKARALEAEQAHIRRSRLMQAYDTLRAENAEVSQ